MKVIYKYACPATPSFSLELPIDALFLCVQNQPNQRPQMWYLIDPEEQNTLRHDFKWWLTGETAEIEGVYRGTCLLLEGTFVCHLFET